ncbi:seryl-tRNA synthetase family protein [Streptococcus pneumoniae]|nr:seryl-tRNA synthetase family protein [Streptococcus pneumoniae]
MAEFTFEIEEHLLTLSENEKGWTKEINRVSFNGAPAKFDIRAWSPDHTKMGKGITLSNEEFQTMVDAFKGILILFENLFKPHQLYYRMYGY